MAIVMMACHTTEANFKASYDLAAQKTREGVGEETYSKIQAEQNKKNATLAGDSVKMRRMFVSAVDDADKAKLKRYNVVIKEFKQKFNATSMCARLRESGAPEAIAVYAGQEKMYYVVAGSYATAEEAAEFMHSMDKKVKFPFKKEEIWILNKP